MFFWTFPLRLAHHIQKKIFVEFFFTFYRLSFCNREKKGYIEPQSSVKISLVMKFKKKSFSFIHQYISAVLIFLLFISQTIHVSFFDKIEAATTDYRDIVSIIVDESTYNNLRGQIRTYANDIQ